MQHRIMLQAAEETETDVTDRRPARGEEKKKGRVAGGPAVEDDWDSAAVFTHPPIHPPTHQPTQQPTHTRTHTHSHASTANFGNEVCQSEIELVADSATCQIRIVSRRPPSTPSANDPSSHFVLFISVHSCSSISILSGYSLFLIWGAEARRRGRSSRAALGWKQRGLVCGNTKRLAAMQRLA